MLANFIYNIKKRIPEFAQYFGIVGAFFTVPQIIKIYFTHNHHAEGVSLFMFTANTLLGIFWVFYGIKRRDKPIIAANLLGAMTSGLVALGVFYYSGLTFYSLIENV